MACMVQEKACCITSVLAAKEATPLSSYFDWLMPFFLHGVLKGFVAIVHQQEGTDGFLWMKQKSMVSYRLNSSMVTQFLYIFLLGKCYYGNKIGNLKKCFQSNFI